jgi:hypothetical protein
MQNAYMPLESTSLDLRGQIITSPPRFLKDLYKRVKAPSGLLCVLAEEINEKTEFNLRAIPWHRRGREFTRILVKKKKTDLDGIVQTIQILGLGRRRLLDCENVRATVQALIEAGDGRRHDVGRHS